MRHKCLITSMIAAGYLLLPAANAQVVGKKDGKPDALSRSQELAGQADALVKQEKVDEALKLYDGALRIDPGNEQALLQRGYANLKARRFKDAQSDCEQVLRLHIMRLHPAPGRQLPRSGSQPDFAQVYHCRALFLASSGDFKGAMKDLAQAITLNPAFIPAYESRADLNQGKREPGRITERLRRARETQAG